MAAAAIESGADSGAESCEASDAVFVGSGLQERVQSQREDIFGPTFPIMVPSGGSRRHSASVEACIRKTEITFIEMADE